MEKTYVFDTNESGLNSSAILASLMQNRGVDPNLMAMLTNASKNQDAWGGNGYTVNDIEKKEIIDMLEGVKCDPKTLESIKNNLGKAELDTGFAYSNYGKQFSIIAIHKASSIGEFINTFEHEKNHLEMHICEALDINPYSEEAAHLSGDLSQLILEEALYSIIEL